jgi:phosphatidylserine/phosphatidylglycerophosphate/cardiolipin synthase-like enzyme
MIEAGLIRGGKRVAEFQGPLTAQLTDLGRKCAESGRLVDEFLEQQQRNQPSQVFHFTGPASGNFNWGEHVTQNATTSNGMVADEVAQLVQAISAALPTLGLTDEQQAAVARDVQVIEGELQRQTAESPGIVKSMLRRTLDTIQQEGGSALGVYIVTTAKHVLGNAGIDLG